VLPTHGGSLRLWVTHADDRREQAPSVAAVLAEEQRAGLEQLSAYADLRRRAGTTKSDLNAFLKNAWREGKKVAGYGAPAKATTLLNYCGVGRDLLEYTVDRSPHKQGRMIPGVRVPIEAPEKILERKPDYVLILPWNIKDEVISQMSGVRDWGAKFLVAIPSLEVID
ncbi:MAG TPA: methyltransferase C-terminal domain-containing protein, partial [Candidatus Eremiobacteraceae bacterium]|nr:methyltransferase C-terminal domain-containing protein [Candidatus Eremiobacteraceae bacterium]